MNAFVGLIFLVQAAAGPTAATPVVEPTPPVTASTPASTPAQPQTTAQPEMICRSEQETGSHIAHRVCRVRLEVEQLAERTGQQLREMHPVISGPGPDMH
jgi:hypothetical protein